MLILSMWPGTRMVLHPLRISARFPVSQSKIPDRPQKPNIPKLVRSRMRSGRSSDTSQPGVDTLRSLCSEGGSPPRDLGFDTWFLNLLGIIWAAPAAGKTLSPPPICRKTRRYLTSSHRAAYGSGTSGGGADRDLESYILWVWAAPGAPTTLPRGAKPPRFLARFSVPLAQTHEILDLRSFSGPPPLVPPPCATV